MRDSLGHRAERGKAVEPAAADDEQVGVRGSRSERGDRLVGRILAMPAGDQLEEVAPDTPLARRSP
jgi:hypothetical protein